MSTYTTEIFIEKARKKHGDLYDYSKTIYVRSKDEVIIICSIHGEFKQIAGNHLQGLKCNLCNNRRKCNTEEFIIKANIKHNFIYDYSKTIYTGAFNKIIIICKVHGEF